MLQALDFRVPWMWALRGDRAGQVVKRSVEKKKDSRLTIGTASRKRYENSVKFYAKGKGGWRGGPY